MTSHADFQASLTNEQNDPAAPDTDPFVSPVLGIWPPDPELSSAGLWRGAAAIAVTGLTTILLLGFVILQSGSRAVILIWISVGLPIVLLASVVGRFSAGHLRLTRRPRH
jgi:hypothetical protein